MRSVTFGSRNGLVGEAKKAQLKGGPAELRIAVGGKRLRSELSVLRSEL